MEYLVVFEQADDGSTSAFVPDLPGCVTCGETPDEAKSMIQVTIRLHLDSLRSHGEPIPKPSATACLIPAS
jgi:predicted RNase H-like HicB family nuclease